MTQPPGNGTGPQVREAQVVRILTAHRALTVACAGRDPVQASGEDPAVRRADAILNAAVRNSTLLELAEAAAQAEKEELTSGPRRRVLDERPGT